MLHQGNKDICYFSETNFREDRQKFGIKLEDCLHHYKSKRNFKSLWKRNHDFLEFACQLSD